MKVKKITIQMKSLDEALDEFVETAEKIKKGKKVKPKVATYVADAETARAIFTDGRIRIIQRLKEKKPKSIYELAKLLKRDFKSVYEDDVFKAAEIIKSVDKNIYIIVGGAHSSANPVSVLRSKNIDPPCSRRAITLPARTSSFLDSEKESKFSNASFTELVRPENAG